MYGMSGTDDLSQGYGYNPMARFLLSRGMQQQGHPQSALGGFSGGINNAMAMALMNPDLMKSMKTGFGNLMNGSSWSAMQQNMNPYGATGAGMSPDAMTLPGGMMGGGV